MNSIKKTALGLLVAILAIGFSAFKKENTGKPQGASRAGSITADYLVQPSENQFQQSNMTPDPLNCAETVTLHCIYDVTTVGKDSIPDQPNYNNVQIGNYVTKGWLVPNEDSRTALYQP